MSCTDGSDEDKVSLGLCLLAAHGPIHNRRIREGSLKALDLGSGRHVGENIGHGLLAFLYARFLSDNLFQCYLSEVYSEPTCHQYGFSPCAPSAVANLNNKCLHF